MRKRQGNYQGLKTVYICLCIVVWWLVLMMMTEILRGLFQ